MKITAKYDLDHPAETVYAILSDVEHMHEYMPMCKRSEVIDRQEGPDGSTVVTADFLVSRKRFNFRQAFDLKFTLKPAQRALEVEEPEGKFGKGVSRVRVEPLGKKGSRVFLDSEFRANNAAFRWLAQKPLFRQGFKGIMERVKLRIEEQKEQKPSAPRAANRQMRGGTGSE